MELNLIRMKIKLIILALIISQSVSAQVPTNYGFTLSKEYSQSISIDKAKDFAIKEIFNSPENVGQFEFDLLDDFTNGELTTLFYRFKEKNKEGIILGFYGDYWNDAGDIYRGFVFKILPKEKATELLNKISKTIEEQQEYLSKNTDNNVYFQYDDITVMIYKSLGIKIRISWIGFDAEWEHTGFTRIKNSFEKDLN
jgi:hypothetical protein